MKQSVRYSVIAAVVAACLLVGQRPASADEEVRCTYRFHNLKDEREISQIETLLRRHAKDGKFGSTSGRDGQGDYREYEFTVTEASKLLDLNAALPTLGIRGEPVRLEQYDSRYSTHWRTATITGSVEIILRFEITPGAKLFYTIGPTPEKEVPSNQINSEGRVAMTVRIPWGQRFVYGRVVLGDVSRYLQIEVETSNATYISEADYKAGLRAIPRPVVIPEVAPPSTRPTTAPSTTTAPRVQGQEIVLTLPGAGEVKLVMRRIPAGSFIMGSAMDENGRDNDEGPIHQVILSKPFYMGVYEVTQEQWEAVMGTYPSHFGGKPKHPVESVSWEDVQGFIEKLNSMGLGTFRLPTEAEWEYACRAGTKTPFYWGDESEIGEYAWYEGNSGNSTHPVGQKKPNAWGLYDMSGNVWEWCQDWYADKYLLERQTDPTGPESGSCRVFRGGGWYALAGGCRSADRYWDSPSLRCNIFGFRLVRAIP